MRTGKRAEQKSAAHLSHLKTSLCDVLPSTTWPGPSRANLASQSLGPSEWPHPWVREVDSFLGDNPMIGLFYNSFGWERGNENLPITVLF